MCKTVNPLQFPPGTKQPSRNTSVIWLHLLRSSGIVQQQSRHASVSVLHTVALGLPPTEGHSGSPTMRKVSLGCSAAGVAMPAAAEAMPAISHQLLNRRQQAFPL